jgi:hypothetical protein
MYLTQRRKSCVKRSAALCAFGPIVSRQRDYDDSRTYVATITVGVLYCEAGLVARQSRERRGRCEPSGNGPDESNARHRHCKPEEADRFAVPKQGARKAP